MLNLAKQLQSHVSQFPSYVDQLATGKANPDFFKTMSIMSKQFLNTVTGYANTAVKQKVMQVYSQVQQFSDQLYQEATGVKKPTPEQINQFKQTAQQVGLCVIP